MAKFYESITPDLRAFIEAQKVFFVASGMASGRINLSPRGADCLRVLDDATVAWLDLTGSGNETAAHLKHDGRLTLMLCSFDADPLILRLYGRGTLCFPHQDGWEAAVSRFPDLPGKRQIVTLHVESLQTSCGFGVPVAQGMAERPRLVAWCTKKGDDALADYRRQKNRRSIDGLSSDTVPAEPTPLDLEAQP